MSEPTASEPAQRPTANGRTLIGLFAAYAVIALALFRPVQGTGFLSDDHTVIEANPYVQEWSVANLREVFDPDGPAIAYALNYSPVHLLFHTAQITMLGGTPAAFHVSNALLHAAATVLLVMLFLSSGIPLPPAAAMGAVFLLHPANVEAVAFIFEAKTLLSTLLAFGAILLFRRIPPLATLLFALALLTKLSALFALPTVAVLAWARHRKGERVGPVLVQLAVWTAVLLAVSIPELHAFQRMGQHAEPIGGDLAGRVRSIVAIAMRYLVMAATGYGVSAFQQPPAAESWLDPWWLAGLVALGLLGWRLGVTLRRRDEEAAWWVLAAASFAPICQLFPFLYPMADRYLYTILPGLMGGALLLGAEAVRRARVRWPALASGPAGRLASPSGAAAVLLVLALPLAAASHRRVPTFRSDATLSAEAARHFPDGIQAWLQRADEAGMRGDAEAAAHALEQARLQGFYGYDALAGRPSLVPVLGSPPVQEVLVRMAGYWVDRLEPIEDPYPIELVNLAGALMIRGDPERAIPVLERARAMDSPYRDTIRQMLEGARLQRARERHERRRAGS